MQNSFILLLIITLWWQMEKTEIRSDKLEIAPLSDLVDRYDYFLLDAYGVFWGSSKVGLLPGSKEAMEYLVSIGKKVGILSNSTQLAPKEKDKLAKHELEEGIHYHFLLTSGQATRQLLLSDTLPIATSNKKYYLFGSDHPRFAPHATLFQGSGFVQTDKLEEADFIYIAIPHIDGVDQEKADIFVEKIKQISDKNIPVLCTNPDCFAHEGNPAKLVVRQGTIANLFKKLGATVHFIGKPYSTVYKKALELFSDPVLKENILMIGDTPETDIRGASQIGMATALVTETGIMSERIKLKGISSAISELPDNDRPDHLIESFKIDGI